MYIIIIWFIWFIRRLTINFLVTKLRQLGFDVHHHFFGIRRFTGNFFGDKLASAGFRCTLFIPGHRAAGSVRVLAVSASVRRSTVK